MLSTCEEQNLILRSQNLYLALFKHLKDFKIILKSIKKIMFSVNNMLQANKDVQKYCQLMKYQGVSDQDMADAEIQQSIINQQRSIIDWTERNKPNVLERGKGV